MIVTGPNEGGKTTAGETLPLSVIFGQTLTIVPANHFAHTIFNKIVTTDMRQLIPIRGFSYPVSLRIKSLYLLSLTV